MIQLELAGHENSQRGFLVLAEKIPPYAIDLAMTETLHIVLDGGGQLLQDGAHAFGYSYQGGTILNVLALSEEPGPASVVEVVGHGTLSLVGSRAEANLEGWDTAMLPKSIIEVRQVSTQCNSKRIDLWIVVLQCRNIAVERSQKFTHW